MPIEQALIKLRVAVRKNSKLVMDNLVDDYLLYRQSRKDLVIVSRCSFCGSTENPTKEHILPKWIFENIQNRHYVNQANGQKIEYSKATIPACRTCNSELLNEIERHIKNIFATRKIGQNEYLIEDCENIVRWLEIIHYKYQVIDLIQRFIAHKEEGMIEYLKGFPVAMLRKGGISPFEIEVGLRQSLKRIAIKNKSSRTDSLTFFKTTNKGFHFFHGDEFVFIELPQFGLAVFYFFRKNFKSEKELGAEVKKIIEEVYN